MQRVDVVAVPSVWWENSPLVIQEALRNKRPVICSDIGGMAEKVRPGIEGFHFNVGSGVALARLLKDLAAEPAWLAEVVAALNAQPSPPKTRDAHLALYDSLQSSPDAACASRRQ